MVSSLSVVATTDIDAFLIVNSIPIGATGYEIQVSSRPDFSWVPSPVFAITVEIDIEDDGMWGGDFIDDGPWGDPMIDDGPAEATASIGELNQSSSYYARGRATFADVDPEPWSEIVGFRTEAGDPLDLTVPAVLIQPAMIVIPEPVLHWEADTTIDGFPVKNLGRDSPIAWRSIGDGDGHYAFEMTTAGAPIDTIALLQTNLPESAVWRVKADITLEGLRGLTPAFSTDSAPFRATAELPQRPAYHGLMSLPAAQQYPFWRVEIDARLPGNVLHAEYAVVGLNRATRNHSVERTEQPLDLGEITRTRSGIADRIEGFRSRRADFDLSTLTVTQHETIYADLYQRVGFTDPILCVPNSKRGPFFHDRILYGNLSGSTATNTSSAFFSRKFTMDSVI